MTPNGHKIYPSEIETILSRVPGIKEGVLVGWPPSENAVKNPVACIYTGRGPNDTEKLKDTLSESFQNALSPEKWPCFLYISPEPLPKNQNGKIIKPDILPFIQSESVTKFPA